MLFPVLLVWMRRVFLRRVLDILVSPWSRNTVLGECSAVVVRTQISEGEEDLYFSPGHNGGERCLCLLAQ
jgi:hypothetical protein